MICSSAKPLEEALVVQWDSLQVSPEGEEPLLVDFLQKLPPERWLVRPLKLLVLEPSFVPFDEQGTIAYCKSR
jgi:hypothetical protein